MCKSLVLMRVQVLGLRLGLGLRALCKSWVLMRVRVFVAACAHAIECASDMLCCVTLCFDGRHVPVAGARGHKRVRKQETARETPAHDVLIPCFWKRRSIVPVGVVEHVTSFRRSKAVDHSSILVQHPIDH